MTQERFKNTDKSETLIRLKEVIGWREILVSGLEAAWWSSSAWGCLIRCATGLFI